MVRAIRQVLLDITGTLGRSIVFAVILFILITPFMICISVWMGAHRELLEAEALKGSEVRLTPNFYEASGNSAVQATGGDEHYVTEELAEKIIGSRYVCDYDYYLWSSAAAELEPVVIDSGQFYIAKQKKSTSPKYLFRVYGYKRLDLQPEFRSGKLKLTAGKFFDDNDKADHCIGVVISRGFADKNGLTTGSTFAIEDSDSKTKQEVEVSGIFDKGEGNNLDFSYAIYANSIFVPLGVAQKLERAREPGLPEGILTTASFYLDSPGHSDEFIAEIKSRNIDLSGYSLLFDDREYKYAVSPLYGVKMISGTFAVILSALCLIYLTITAISQGRKRRKEICLLMISGMSRKQILARLSAGTIIISMVSFTAAGFAGTAAAPSAADFLMNGQVRAAVTAEQTLSSIYISGDDYSPADSTSRGIAVDMTPQAAWSLIEKIDMTADFRSFLLFVAAVMFMLLCQFLALALGAARNRPFDTKG